jgi:hypothetical protein
VIDLGIVSRNHVDLFCVEGPHWGLFGARGDAAMRDDVAVAPHFVYLARGDDKRIAGGEHHGLPPYPRAKGPGDLKKSRRLILHIVRSAGGSEVSLVRSAVEDHPPTGFHIPGGLVVASMLGAQNIVPKKNLHVAIQGIDVTMPGLLPRLDDDLLGGPSRLRLCAHHPL